MTPALSDVFAAIAHKRLVQVDLPNKGSNQHELNASTALREFFNTGETLKAPITWHLFQDDQEPLLEIGDLTFYDARAKSAERTGRSEWRIYYTGDFLSNCEEGDELVLIKTIDGAYHGMVFQAGSAQLRAARILFGIGESGEQIQLLPADHIGQQKLELIRREILASLDIEVQTPVVESDMDIVLAKFGKRFPTTREMSEFARSQTDLGTRDPDDALLAWVDREEQLFRALEEVIIKDRIREGFAEVDDFISYSLSVQNRRKSRMGHALQHHLAAVFTGSGVQFEEQVRTEGGNKPDFIFPGALQYRDPGFPEDSLLMLGVKSSAKDRWRQILPEAERIKNKHLCTLEHGISENQTRQMQQMSVTLVIPEGIHPTYSDDQRRTLLNLGAFIELVRSRQS